MSRKYFAENKFGSRLILCVSVAVFVFALYQLVQIGQSYYMTEREYDDLKRRVVSTEAEERSDTEMSSFFVDFERLKKENPDCIAWIHFPGLEISYPIMQGEDNEYYLEHDFSGERVAAASIFMDSMNREDFSDENTFIYGHNMKDDSMFGLLDQYEEEEFCRENPGFYIYTPDKTMYYSIFSCYRADIEEQEDSFILSFASAEDYEEYRKVVLERSLYETGVSLQRGQKMVTLMTCNRSGYRYRFLVHAVQTEM